MKKVIIFGEAEPGAIAQAENCLVEAEAMLLMADNHKGYGMPVGGVAVYRDRIPPAGVGFDIACGNKAVKLDLKLSQIEEALPEIAEALFVNLSFGIGRKNPNPVGHPLFDSPAWDEVDFLRNNPELKRKAEAQLGTIGSGNHYVDVFADEEGNVWIGVHFGSRGLGHTIASHFMKLAGDNLNIMDERPHTLDVRSKDGQDYIAAMELAGAYAYAGRDWVCAEAARIIGGRIIDEVHNHHNFAWRETHDGKEYWVVRKGATPAFPGQRSFVGSSMGDISVILRGVDSPRSREAFYSTVHGAGRVMSRTQAAGRKRLVKVFACRNRDCEGVVPIDAAHREGGGNPRCPECGGRTQQHKRWQQTAKGLIDFGKVKAEMAAKGIILKGAGPDEAPQVYKKLDEVLQAHEGTIEILHRLRPLIVCMAGPEEYDPYKD